MLDQQTNDVDLTHPPVAPRAWAEPAVRAVRRAQPPPSRPRDQARRGRRFWGHLVLSVVLAALIPIIAAIGANAEGSITARLLVAFAVPVLAGLAVTASAAATGALPRLRRHGRRRD